MNGLRMKELVERTGASREAIRFYINEGLLPQPRRTSRNMAWYNQEHVSRVRYIRALQEEHFLPLKAIRAVLDGEGAEQFSPQQLRQFEVLRQREEAGHAGESRKRFDAVAAELGLTTDEQQAARDLGFVNDDGSLGPADEELVRIWATLRTEGLTPERGFGPSDMAAIQSAVDVLLSREIEMFTARLEDMNDDELGRVFERIIPNINRAFALLHERRLRQFLQQITQQQKGDTP